MLPRQFHLRCRFRGRPPRCRLPRRCGAREPTAPAATLATSAPNRHHASTAQPPGAARPLERLRACPDAVAVRHHKQRSGRTLGHPQSGRKLRARRRLQPTDRPARPPRPPRAPGRPPKPPLLTTGRNRRCCSQGSRCLEPVRGTDVRRAPSPGRPFCASFRTALAQDFRPLLGDPTPIDYTRHLTRRVGDRLLH